MPASATDVFDLLSRYPRISRDERAALLDGVERMRWGVLAALLADDRFGARLEALSRDGVQGHGLPASREHGVFGWMIVAGAVLLTLALSGFHAF